MLTLSDGRQGLSMAVKPKNTRTKIILKSFLALGIAGMAIFWVTAPEDVKEELKVKVQETISENTLEAITSIIVKPSEPPVVGNDITIKMGVELEAINEVIEDTQAAQNIGDTQTAQGILNDSNLEGIKNPSAMPNVLAPVQEDSVVSAQFLDDLAQLMVSRYNPSNNSVNLGIKSLNVHYGTSLNGLKYDGPDFFAGREYILRYIFSPSMLSGLYKLYSNKFINKVVEAAAQPKEGKALSKKQLNAMFIAYSKDISSLAIIMANISKLTDLKEKIANIQKINQKATSVQVKMNEAIFALDEERDSASSNPDKMKQLEADVNILYTQQTAVASEKLDIQSDFAKSIRGQSSLRDVEDEMLIYVAYWVNRRLETQADALKAVAVAANILSDLSKLLQKSASE